MILVIDNSRPTNKNRSRFSSPAAAHRAPCSQIPFCAIKNNYSFINLNNKIYNQNHIFAINNKTTKDNYPYYKLFGTEDTIQNLYSADPQKLRLGVF